jgi:hypothetical protein
MRISRATLGSYAGLGVLLLAPPVLFGISSPLWAWAPLELAVLAWVLVSITPSMRRVEMQSAVEVACSTAAAFELVSDPRNWQRYIPELEVVGPVEHPVHPGTVIRVRIHSGGNARTAEEIVTIYEPPRSFGTAIPVPPHESSGTYDFAPSVSGTAIAYTFQGSLSPIQSALGGWLLRGRLVKKMARRRGAAMREIKRLLEERSSASV